MILRMKRQQDAGCSIHEVAAQLNRDGIPTKLPKGTRIKLRNAKNGEPEVWAESSGRWQGSQVAKILASKHTARFLEEHQARLEAESLGGENLSNAA